MMAGPSDHLTWKELACKDGTPYPQAWRDSRAVALARVFEIIRAEWGKPIPVVSAYRSEAHNIAVGGAERSQHLLGRALDLRPPKGVTVKAFHARIVALVDVGALQGLVGGIGKYRSFVHVDTRPGTRVLWSGKGD